MVPERQAFHPSQKAVKAVADSTVVLRPRRSRAKYRDNNNAIEAKPSRLAQKRRHISRMDSLSDSKTSEGSDSCLEAPEGRGLKVSGNRKSEVPGTLQLQDPKSHGSAVPVAQGLSDPVSQDSDDPAAQVLPDPLAQRSDDQVAQGLPDPVSQDSDFPVAQILPELVAERSDDSVTQGMPDPVSLGSDDPVTQSLEVLISELKADKGKTRVKKPPKKLPKKKSDVKTVTPTKEALCWSTSEIKHDIGGGERMLMRQWLESEADGDRIPGLKWLDKQDGLIRINWRHGSRAEWSTSDVTPFRSWAQHTGRYNSREPDYKRWKANFRCAVNSLQDVREVKEMRGTKAGDPYKVYKLLPAIPTKKRRRESVKSGRSSSPENVLAALEMPIKTDVAIKTDGVTIKTDGVTIKTDDMDAEPMESDPLPAEEPLLPELFLQLMPLPGGAECEQVITWSSGEELEGIPTSEDMENLVTLDAPLLYVEHCYANATDGSVQKLLSLPPPPCPPPAAPFNNAIPLPVQNLIDSEEEEEEEEEEFQTMTLPPENLGNLSELNIGELFSFGGVQANSITSTNESNLLLENMIQALLNQPGGIIITSDAV